MFLPHKVIHLWWGKLQESTLESNIGKTFQTPPGFVIKWSSYALNWRPSIAKCHELKQQMKARPAWAKHKNGNITTGKKMFALKKFTVLCSFHGAAINQWQQNILQTIEWEPTELVRYLWKGSALNVKLRQNTNWLLYPRHCHIIDHLLEGLKVFQQCKLVKAVSK